jgi:electron transfer flavoprotein beta subunit
LASLDIPRCGASELSVDSASVGEAAAKVKRQDYFVPAIGKGAEILEGSSEEIADKLIELLKAKGGLQ